METGHLGICLSTILFGAFALRADLEVIDNRVYLNNREIYCPVRGYRVCEKHCWIDLNEQYLLVATQKEVTSCCDHYTNIRLDLVKICGCFKGRIGRYTGKFTCDTNIRELEAIGLLAESKLFLSSGEMLTFETPPGCCGGFGFKFVGESKKRR